MLVRNEVLSASNERVITNIARIIIAQRSELRDEGNEIALGRKALPALFNFELVLDYRLAMKDGEVVQAVPVVVGNLETDVEPGIIWFQMNERQIEEIQNRLAIILSELRQARAWFQEKSKR